MSVFLTVRTEELNAMVASRAIYESLENDAALSVPSMIAICRCGPGWWRQVVRSIHWNVQDEVEWDEGGM